MLISYLLRQGFSAIWIIEKVFSLGMLKLPQNGWTKSEQGRLATDS
jgi:hypothetical protein